MWDELLNVETSDKGRFEKAFVDLVRSLKEEALKEEQREY